MAGLTDQYFRAQKAMPGRRREIADDAVRGLSMRITEAGVKTWALRYRTPGGQQRRLTLGPYPAVSLADARIEARKALGAVAARADPARDKLVQRRLARRARIEKPQTLKDLWRLYERDRLPRKRNSTADYERWVWRKHLEPRIGDNDLAGLDRATVRDALREIGAEAPTTANRALALLRFMLNVAVDDELLPASPLARMGALYAEKSRERVFNDTELAAFWQTLEAAPGRSDLPVGVSMVAALKLVLLTAARPGDVAGLRAGEIDGAARSWTIPGERFKNKRPHTVPLSPEAWVLLVGAFGSDDPGNWKGPAFPNRKARSKPIERRSLTRAMAHVMAEITPADGDQQIERATPHDLRRTASTYLASERIGVAPHVVSAVLGHTPEGPTVTSVYNRHRYDKEKRAALEAWAKLLFEIFDDKKRASSVAQFRKKRAPG